MDLKNCACSDATITKRCQKFRLSQVTCNKTHGEVFDDRQMTPDGSQISSIKWKQQAQAVNCSRYNL